MDQGMDFEDFARRRSELSEMFARSAFWRTRWAIGICRKLATGPSGEPWFETKLEQAVCVALMYDKNPHLFLEKEAIIEFGEKTWEAAKRVLNYIKEEARKLEQQ